MTYTPVYDIAFFLEEPDILYDDVSIEIPAEMEEVIRLAAMSGDPPYCSDYGDYLYAEAERLIKPAAIKNYAGVDSHFDECIAAGEDPFEDLFRLDITIDLDCIDFPDEDLEDMLITMVHNPDSYTPEQIASFTDTFSWRYSGNTDLSTFARLVEDSQKT